MAAALIAVSALAGTASAREVQIGVANFEPRIERDTINVGGKEGQFRSFRFQVRQSDVEVLDVKVIYGNGQTEDIRVRQTFKAGTSSRVIDLDGARRAIKQIVVTYVARGPASIVFYGVEGGGGGPVAAKWERLGCKDVRFVIDRDVLKVGRKEGRYSAIRLKVRNAPIEVFDAGVIFGNGLRQDIRVRAVIPAGGETRQLDLVGDNRGIDRVEFLYRSIPNFKGTAELCVDALPR